MNISNNLLYIFISMTFLFFQNCYSMELEPDEKYRAIIIDFIDNLMVVNPDHNAVREELDAIQVSNIMNKKFLTFYDCQLDQLPPQIGNLWNLTSLCLTRNELTQLPPEIGKLTSLTTLFLNNNKISQLSDEIWNLKALKELNLEFITLEELSPDIGKLTNLTTLIISYNKITHVPAEIGKLTNLKQLDLRQNQLLMPKNCAQLFEGPKLINFLSAQRRVLNIKEIYCIFSYLCTEHIKIKEVIKIISELFFDIYYLNREQNTPEEEKEYLYSPSKTI